MTRPHSPTVAGAAQDCLVRICGANYRESRPVHLISRLTLGETDQGTSERAQSTPSRTTILSINQQLLAPKMLNNIQYILLAVDFSELLNIVVPWKPRSTASTIKFSS